MSSKGIKDDIHEVKRNRENKDKQGIEDTSCYFNECCRKWSCAGEQREAGDERRRR